MGFQDEFQASLEAINVHSAQLLQYLKTNRQPEADGSGLPRDPFDAAPKSIKISRKKFTEASASLVGLGTRPEEYLEHLQNGYQELTCVRWLINLDILEYIPQNGVISYNDLAAKARVPWSQLRAITRMAICNGFLQEPRPNVVAHSRISALFARDQSFLNWARWMVNYSVPTAYKLPEATKMWGETSAKDQTAFNLGLDSKLPFFDHLRQTPAMTDLFAAYMRNVAHNETWSLQHAVDGFDWAALPAGSKVVDVGGSHGHLSIAIASKFPHLHFIVQDLPESVSTARTAFEADHRLDASVKGRISFMDHDFFGPQPVKDADVYLLRMIIHDWPDKDAKNILSNIQASLKPGAKVVIMDTILPQPRTIPAMQEQQLRIRDLTMMQVFNAKERELDDWKALASTAVLQITNVHQPHESVMGLITLESAAPPSPPHVPVQTVPAVPTAIPSNVIVHPTTADKPVLIMGAGIGGLCLAQALKKASIPFRVFERDQAVDSRPQGYRLKLEADAAKALEESLDTDTYAAFVTSCAVTTIGETDFNPFNGNIVHSRAGGGLSGKMGLYPSFTVDRRVFRNQLMSGIKDKITFGKEMVSYITDEADGTITVSFKDGSSIEGSFLVGADGLHSVVRKNRQPNHPLVDTGAACIYGKTVMTPELLQRFPEKGLRWMTVASDSAPMLQSCLIGESPITVLIEPIRFSAETRNLHPELPADYVYWALIGRKERFDLQIDADVSTAKVSGTAADLSLAVTAEWHTSLRSLFELQDRRQSSMMRVASTVCDIPAWQPTPNITALGDAVHPMSPCGGVGAMTALCDAAALAKIIKAGLTTELMGKFEAEMRKRAWKSIKRSEIGSKKMFGQKDLVDCPPFQL
ncbi:hypothetical protein M409DRAFT_62405 [Zasmidium cellare ATCC 36951]|uniref:O-methyltransferase domain-containing protein n=1 Tax=Zasmidium cellare ATCC 36951 TaxID=1080233 RepID=A0A6A6CZW4_ZASCE|nr:uncharacterized protein M409DRAFT_62405 [Zasmidium cellare ATCC 36951]KAF2172651.1 hypothetical protein M409DRAFT_62405 [Zasmidium cellare ATCC 36951]